MARCSNRAFRRFHKERMKQKAMNIYPYDDEAYKLADHLAHCSCPYCGNPRHHSAFKKSQTKQEFLSDLNLYDQLNEEEISIPKSKLRKRRFNFY